ncbi:MAG: NUDIX domain-containing protein [Planctomycetota bacterium]|jgi:8-oxo-dGTP diphosphatase
MTRPAEQQGRQVDFLGAFALLESAERVLMVQNRRIIAGRETLTWDLPGGRVEAGELLEEALLRELREETRLASNSSPRFLFYQEGERLSGGTRSHAWRSFFFALDHWEGEARAGAEILDLRWMDREELRLELQAPYHDSFLRWLDEGGLSFSSSWRD